MTTHRSLSIWLCVVAIISLFCLCSALETSKEEIDALNALWNATGGPDWKLSWEDPEVCARPGVDCDEEGHVVVLKLEDCNMDGVIPDEIGDLRWLTFLSMMGNKLEGTLPTSMEQLTSLHTLNLAGNRLQGSFPACIQSMTKLRILFIGQNLFDGLLPSWVGALPLVMFGVSGNQFSGQLPTSLGNLGSLTDLYVDGNGFEGPLPSSLKELKGLVNLVVHNNRLNGDIPTWVGNFKNLEWLGMDNNNFSGVFPSPIFADMVKLRKLHVGNNPLLYGTLSPDMFSQLHENLFSIFVSGTKLTGEIPATIASLPSLAELRVNDACFVGGLPEELCPVLSNLTIAEFSNSFFECPIPDCFEDYTTCVTPPAQLPDRCIVEDSSSFFSSESNDESDENAASVLNGMSLFGLIAAMFVSIIC